MKELHSPSKSFIEKANINKFEDYQKLYIESINSPVDFWTKQAESNLKWIKKWDSVYKQDFKGIGTKVEPYVEYFKGGTLNVSENCIDRHLDVSANKTAIIWQGEDSSQHRTLTYQDLYLGVCKLANSLLKLGIKKGDAITIYMPMVPEAIMAMLACSRIGAIHSVVFSAFSSESLKNRINDCSSKIVITSDVSYYGGKTLDILTNVEKIIDDCPTIENVIVYNRASNPPIRESSPRKETKFINNKFHWWHELVLKADSNCPPTEMSAEDPLFILYTSGSTGKPKGVLHTTAGYLLYANLTFKYVFDYKETDIFWCTADIGWITGHSYLVYGPLSNGATCMMYEGTPTFPAPTRFWEIIDKYKVTVFYTAPTAIRSLMKFGEKILEDFSLKSLRLLGTVGEPINPESWEWYYKFIGKERCPIVDTWWQTETGGIMITTLPGAMSMKPGSAGLPFFGIVPKILNDAGEEITDESTGKLFIKNAWPSMLRGVYGDSSNSLISKTYFCYNNEMYFTGDGCAKDKNGYYWLKGRVDDVLNVSAHRLSTAELESAIVSHHGVAEAAVVGYPHETKGQALYCFVMLKNGVVETEDLRLEIKKTLREQISPIATPDKIQFVNALPKTRSGKIIRRILRKIAEGDLHSFGDLSTLADRDVLDGIIKGML